MTVKVFKIGGNVVDNPGALRRFVAGFARIDGPKILVHGGGKEATRLCRRLDIPTTMIDGRRVTDSATLDVVTMVYAGLINKRIVAMLQAEECDAVGLTGADGNAVRAVRRPDKPVDYGFVGDIKPEGVNCGFLVSLLESGKVPVFCAIMHDGGGNLLNCNADSVASAVAKGMSGMAEVELTFCFELPGVLRDINDTESVIASITPANVESLKAEGAIAGGMIPKIDNAIDAVQFGVKSVIIKSSDDLLVSSGTVVSL